MKKVALPDYWWEQLIEMLEDLSLEHHGISISERMAQEIRSQTKGKKS